MMKSGKNTVCLKNKTRMRSSEVAAGTHLRWLVQFQSFLGVHSSAEPMETSPPQPPLTWVIPQPQRWHRRGLERTILLLFPLCLSVIT